MTARARWYAYLMLVPILCGTAAEGIGPSGPDFSAISAPSNTFSQLVFKLSLIDRHSYLIERNRLLDATSKAQETYREFLALLEAGKSTEAFQVMKTNPMLWRETTMRDADGQLTRVNYLLPYAVKMKTHIAVATVTIASFTVIQIVAFGALLVVGMTALRSKQRRTRSILALLVIGIVGTVGAEIGRNSVVHKLRTAVRELGGGNTLTLQEVVAEYPAYSDGLKTMEAISSRLTNTNSNAGTASDKTETLPR
mgnify:CR=1 FL=1